MLITHDMGVIAEIADRVAVMYAGRIAEISEVHELIRHPLHPYTQGLMAAIPTLEARASRLAQIPGACRGFRRSRAAARSLRAARGFSNAASSARR